MKKLILLLLFSVLIKLYSISQVYQWANSTTGSGLEECSAITTDDLDNVYSVGSYYGIIAFEEGLANVEFSSENGSRDFFVQKTDEYGNLLWVKSIGGNNDDGVSNIIVDNNGDLIIIGSFKDTVDFDTGENETILISENERDLFVLKMSNIGDLIWVYSFGIDYYSGISGVQIDNDLNIVISGNFNGNSDFGSSAPNSVVLQSSVPASNSSFASSAYMLKLSPLGEFISVVNNQNRTSLSSNYVVSSIIGDSNEVFVAGSYMGVVDFDPSVLNNQLTTNGSNVIESFIQSVNSDGELLWVKTLVSDAGVVRLYDFQQDGNDDFYTLGQFYGTVDFDLNNGSVYDVTADSIDYFICKYDEDFNLLWVKTLIFHDRIYFSVNGQGELFLSGYFYDTTDFNPGIGVSDLISVGEGDIFVLKLNTNGEFVWVTQIGSPAWEEVFTIHTDESNVYLGGYFKDTVDFNPSIGNNVLISPENNSDMFILKLNSENVGIQNNDNNYVLVYPNPSTGKITIQLPENEYSAQLKIVNYSGQLAFESNINSINSQIDLSHLSVGVYFLNLILESGEVLNSKIVLDK